MRITPQMIVDSTLSHIETNQNRIEQLQNQITSGSRIAKPSDDPIGVARALNLQDSIAQSEQYQRNIDQATSWLNTTDSAMQSVSDAMNRARELAMQAANDTLGAPDRAAIQAEITQLQQHVLDLAHAKYGAYYLFAGTRSDQPGYVQAADSTTTPGAYQGNNAQILRELAPGTTMGVNADAQLTFDPVFKAMSTLQLGLTANNSTAIRSSLAEFDTALDAVNAQRAGIGAK